MTQSGKGVRDTAVLFTCFAFSLVPIACSSSEVTTSGGVTVVSSGTLEEFEGYIPIAPDSVVELYRTYNQQRFYERYGEEVRRTAVLLDSLNQDIPPSQRIDTLSIEFALEQFGSAVRKGRSIGLSSGFFFVYNNPSILRSILFHEHGHVRYEMLSQEDQSIVQRMWNTLQRAALMYVFIDGEYSGNAWFGGHPEENPEELFASAYNLFHNKPDEFRATMRYVPAEYYEFIDSLRSVVRVDNLVLFD